MADGTHLERLWPAKGHWTHRIGFTEAGIRDTVTICKGRTPVPDSLCVMRLPRSAFLRSPKFVMPQSASPDANPDILTVRISEDGVCHVQDASTPCDQLGQYLLTKHLAQNEHIHIEVDRSSKYELVVATLESLRGTGFKIGFVNYDPNARLREFN
jgi:hypothetical protein